MYFHSSKLYFVHKGNLGKRRIFQAQRESRTKKEKIYFIFFFYDKRQNRFLASTSRLRLLQTARCILFGRFTLHYVIAKKKQKTENIIRTYVIDREIGCVAMIAHCTMPRVR